MGKRQTESRNEAIITAITKGGMSYEDAATRFNISSRWARTLVKRYELGGIEAIHAQSKRPHTNPNQTPEPTRQRIFFLRNELTRAGLDAGPESIWDRLDEPRPHPTTIYRILQAAGHITPNPKKRPKRSYIRFQAHLPNEMWQSDFTHISLADGTVTEVITWLDDHSRYALHISAHPTITVHTVIDTFTQATEEHGYPASTLTDNAMVYTTRLAGGASEGQNQQNMFEKLLFDLHIKQKNGLPGHPTTQGKVERFQATMKKWLKPQPPATTITELNSQLTQFQTIYNQFRPHRSLDRQTPNTVYQSLPPAEPTIEENGQHWRIRHDKIGGSGTVTYRYAGKLKHLAVGREHKGATVIILASGPHTTVINQQTGEIIAEHTINPDNDYQPKTRHKSER